MVELVREAKWDEATAGAVGITLGGQALRPAEVDELRLRLVGRLWQARADEEGGWVCGCVRAHVGWPGCWVGGWVGPLALDWLW